MNFPSINFWWVLLTGLDNLKLDYLKWAVGSGCGIVIIWGVSAMILCIFCAFDCLEISHIWWFVFAWMIGIWIIALGLEWQYTTFSIWKKQVNRRELRFTEQNTFTEVKFCFRIFFLLPFIFVSDTSFLNHDLITDTSISVLWLFLKRSLNAWL